MLLADLMMVSALSVYAVRDEAPAQDDPWMDYAQEHLGNTLPFMREEELSFLEAARFTWASGFPPITPNWANCPTPCTPCSQTAR